MNVSYTSLPVLSPNESSGPFVIGYTLSFSLMGLLTLQTYIYLARCSNDLRWIKAFVGIMFFTELLISVFTFHGFWAGAVRNGNLASIVGAVIETDSISFNDGTFEETFSTPDILWSMQALTCLTGFVSFMTHGFFCWRVWCLKRSRFIPVSVMTVRLNSTFQIRRILQCKWTLQVSLVQFAMIAYGGIQFGLSPRVTSIGFGYSLEFYIPVWLCASLLCDVTITVYMTIILRHEGLKSSFNATRSLSAKLIRLTIETGLVTTVAAVLELILATALSETLWHLAVFYTISKLYANCVLANLNARQGLRDYDVSQSVVYTSHSRINFGPPPNTELRVEAKVEADDTSYELLYKRPAPGEP
ncbi:hypothetical protein BV22DRAFT_1031765 [Leucogyrophana mollusca]|uniref:Uncharacterized protein n=1 Tax=Leucogyrophana mollusca TaxID=85980 RepID=A0ACB8BQA3_9AGAM|nr:hypothetical protein BV22DRAFT_1031765 [Leucogyrophana mollusca]